MTYKVLITGAAGQLGKDCSQILKNEPEYEVITRTSSQLDISNEKSVTQQIQDLQPDLIINCAAFTAVDKCETEQNRSWQVNADGPAFLARAIQKTNGRIIHISTDYVFPGDRTIPEPYCEDDPVKPVSQYGIGKLKGEENIRKFCPNHCILRTAWLYSMHGNNFLKTMLRLSLGDPKRQMNVVNDQYGSLTWTYTLARQIESLIKTELTGTFHATAEGYSTWYQAACYFLEAMQIPHNLSPCTTAQYPTPARRPANSILENKNLKEAGISTFTTWQNDVDKFVATHKDELINTTI